MVNQWLEKYYCEGEINDILSKLKLWLNFKDTNHLQDSKRSALFSYLGNMIRRAPFKESTNSEEEALKNTALYSS